MEKERNIVVFEKMKVWIGVFVFNVAVAAFLLFAARNLPPKIPIFYGRPTGEAQLAEKYVIFVPIAITSVIGIFNFLFSLFVSNKFIKNVFLGSFIILSALSAITIVKIVFLVGKIF